MNISFARLVKFVAIAITLCSEIAYAQVGPVNTDLCSINPDYCTGRRLTIVVGALKGSAADLSAQRLSEALRPAVRGNQVFVENRAGASAMVTAEFVARYHSDPSALLLASWDQSVTVAPGQPDPLSQLTPVAQVASVPYVLIVSMGDRSRTISDFIVTARSSGEAFPSFVTTGTRSANALLTELFVATANLRATSIRHGGPSDALHAVMTGDARAMFAPLHTVSQSLREGRVRALAITGTRRSDTFPDLPTLAEAGLDEANVTGWQAVFAASGLPTDLVRRLQEATATAVATPQFVAAMRAAGLEAPTTREPAEFMALLEHQARRITQFRTMPR